MPLLKSMNTIGFSALVLLCTASGTLNAQLMHNQYPCAECAVGDNNGNDLKGLIISNKRDLYEKGDVVNTASGNTWGYMQIRSATVPSVNKSGEKKGELNYVEAITATYALYKTKDGAQAAWWARETNNPKGPLTSRMVKETGDAPEIPIVRYETITEEIEPKVFTIVEYSNNLFNERDFDVLLKNYVLVENGAIKTNEDYKSIISFYNDFLKKFTYVDDPILGKRSFITMLATPAGNKYIGYFNIVNGKLAGHLEFVDFQYQKDKDALVKKIFGKLTGSLVYVYGDDNFDLEKPIVMYAREHEIKLKRRHTNTDKKFNEDK